MKKTDSYYSEENHYLKLNLPRIVLLIPYTGPSQADIKMKTLLSSPSLLEKNKKYSLPSLLLKYSEHSNSNRNPEKMFPGVNVSS